MTNNSTIAGAAFGAGLGAGGLVSNTSSITGSEYGVIVYGAVGTVTNSGNITATVDDGVALLAGGSVTNASGTSISGLRAEINRAILLFSGNTDGDAGIATRMYRAYCLDDPRAGGGVAMEWDDGRTSSIHHNDMRQVEREPANLIELISERDFYEVT